MKSRFLSFLIIIAMLFGMVPNVGMVTAFGQPAPAQTVDDLALQAVRNIYEKYQGGAAVDGAGYTSFDSYYGTVLIDAGIDLSTWERNGTNLKDEFLALIDETVLNLEGKTSKRIAQDYFLAQKLGQTTRSEVLLDALVDAQTSAGALSSNFYGDAPAYDILGEAGATDGFDKAVAVSYINGRQGSDGCIAWDFTATAQAARALKYLDETQASIASASAWLQTKQLGDGSYSVHHAGYTWDGVDYPSYYEDFLIDTAEMLKFMTLADSDWVTTTSEGAAAADYLVNEALNDDGTFGTSKNLMDDVWALEAYINLGANISIDAEVDLTINERKTRLDKGEQCVFTLNGFIMNGNSDGVSASNASWSVSNSSKAAIDSNGVLTAIDVGEVTVTATYEGISDSVVVEVYSLNDLALQAVRNIYEKYQDGLAVGEPETQWGAYMSSSDCKAIIDAGIDISTWERNGTNLKEEIEAHIEGASGRDAKQLAQDYLYLDAAGETTPASAVLDMIKAMQTSTGALSESMYADATAFDMLGEAGVFNFADALNNASAENYLEGAQGSDGSWAWGDFASTAQIARALKLLDPDSESVTSAAAWLGKKQLENGSYNNSSVYDGVTYWDDALVDTAEMLLVMTAIDSDWASTTSEGAAALDYLGTDAWNDDGTFGGYKNLADDVYALKSFMKMGATTSGASVIGITIDADDSNIYEDGDTSTFTATKHLFDGTTQSASASDLDWSVDESSKASVSDGVLSASSAGDVVVTANLDGMTNSESITIYSLDDLAMQAVQNAYDRYQDGALVDGAYGNFDSYHGAVLVDAGIDLSTWERNDTNLRAEMIDLIDASIASPSDMSSKRIAQDYFLAQKIGDTARAEALLNVLKGNQTIEGALSSNYLGDANAFDLLREAGDLNKVSTTSAIDYIKANQNQEEYTWGYAYLGWNSDFMGTAQSVRNLIELEPESTAVTSGVAWLQSKQTIEGSFLNGAWDDPLIDTAEMLKTMTLMDPDWESATTEGTIAVEYLCMDALNEDGTFGTSGNLADDIWAIEAYLSLGAELDLGLSVSPADSSITENNTKQYSASVIGLSGTENVTESVEWSVSDNSKASIDSNGLLTAKNPGVVTVRASYNGLVGQTELTISNYEAPMDRAYVTVKGYGETILPRTSVTIGRGDSVLDVTKDILDSRNISYTASGGYVSEIDGIKEKDYGAQSGWMVLINGDAPPSSTDNVSAENGDNIYWFYTSDWTEEEGAFAGEIEETEVLADDLLADEDSTLEEIDAAFDALMEEEGEDAADTLILLAESAIKKSGQVSLEMDGNEPADMDASDLEVLSEAAVDKASDLSDEFEEEGIALDKALESRVFIRAEEDEDAASVEFEAGALARAFDANLDQVAVATPWAEIELGADTLSDEDVDKEVLLEVKPADDSDLPEGADVPDGSTVIDMNLFVGGEKVSNFKGSMTVSIPVEYDGDNEAALTVYWLQDDGSVVPVGGAYNEESGMIVFETNHFSKYFADESHVSFDDMELAAWAEEQVSAMAGKGFVNGRGPGQFDPSNDIRRAEFVAIVTRMLSLEASYDYTAEFADVSDSDWFAASVAAASEAGLMNGKGGGMFDPNGKITRQEQAVVLANILQNYGYFAGSTDLKNVFEDATDIAYWAEDGAICAVHHGLINGMDGRFAPNEKATRAQSAVMLYRLYAKIIK